MTGSSSSVPVGKAQWNRAAELASHSPRAATSVVASFHSSGPPMSIPRRGGQLATSDFPVPNDPMEATE